MKLSLLIPFYNEEKQIPITLSVVTPILESTGLDFELVLVDDGSPDAAVSRARSWRPSSRVPPSWVPTMCTAPHS